MRAITWSSTLTNVFTQLFTLACSSLIWLVQFKSLSLFWKKEYLVWSFLSAHVEVWPISRRYLGKWIEPHAGLPSLFPQVRKRLAVTKECVFTTSACWSWCNSFEAIAAVLNLGIPSDASPNSPLFNTLTPGRQKNDGWAIDPLTLDGAKVTVFQQRLIIIGSPLGLPITLQPRWKARNYLTRIGHVLLNSIASTLTKGENVRIRPYLL